MYMTEHTLMSGVERKSRIDELMSGIVPAEFSFVGEEDDFKDPENIKRVILGEKIGSLVR